MGKRVKRPAMILGASLLGDHAGVSGSGNILTLKFRGLKDGASPMTLENVTCRDQQLSLHTGIQAGGGTASWRAEP